MKLTFYKAHPQDYYCREKPYRVFKGSHCWMVQRINSINATINNVVAYCESMQEAKHYVSTTE